MSEFGFGAIEAWPSASLDLGLGKRKEGHAVGAHPSDEMMSVLEQAAGKVARGIISIGHHGERLGPVQAQQQMA